MAVYRNTVSAWATCLLSTGDHILRAPSGVQVLQVADFTTAQKIKDVYRFANIPLIEVDSVTAVEEILDAINRSDE